MEHGHQDSGLATRPFRILVAGRLDRGFSEGLAGIEQENVPEGTMLSGVALDQSHLHSTLDLLRNLGIEVVRFEVDPSPQTPRAVEGEGDAQSPSSDTRCGHGQEPRHGRRTRD